MARPGLKAQGYRATPHNRGLGLSMSLRFRNTNQRLALFRLALCGLVLVFCTLQATVFAQAPLPPPATFYGWIIPAADFAPAAGMIVKAEINGVLCGQTSIIIVEGQLAYVLQVDAEAMQAPFNGCGTPERTVVFSVGPWRMDHDRLWSNQGASFQPLNKIVPPGSTPTPITVTPTSDTSTPAGTMATPVTPAANTPTATLAADTPTPVADDTPPPAPTSTPTPAASSTPSVASINYLPLIDR